MRLAGTRKLIAGVALSRRPSPRPAKRLDSGRDRRSLITTPHSVYFDSGGAHGGTPIGCANLTPS